MRHHRTRRGCYGRRPDHRAVGTAGAVAVPAGAARHRRRRADPAPGFIDLQFNGGFGHDFTDDPASIWHVAAQLPQYGVTAFLPTVITSPLEKIAAGPAGA